MPIVKEIRAVLGNIPMPSGSTTKIWVSASKPPEHRRQDKEVIEVIQIFRKLFQVTAEKDERLEADYAKGRVLWTGELVAHPRRVDVQGLQFRMETLKQIDATITSERLEDLRQTVKREKTKMDQMWDNNWHCSSCLGVLNVPFQQSRDCCIHAGLQLWTWNACAISFDDLVSLHARLSEPFRGTLWCFRRAWNKQRLSIPSHRNLSSQSIISQELITTCSYSFGISRIIC